jgi:hypothetical protein
MFVAAACAVFGLWAQPASGGYRVLDRDGIVYRPVDGALRFHPLLSFQALNGHVGAKRRAKARRLARALLRRAERDGNTLVWRYQFSYQGHRPGWRSGMAQAVAAEALARAGFVRFARRAFLAVPNGLLARPAGVVWIKLYSFSPLPVLNAQLQSALSLRRYAAIARDRRAARLSARLLAAADVLFPQFETACWSRYSLHGREATPLYHRFVGELVMRVAARKPSWRARAARIYASQRRPVLARGASPRTLYPVPAEGFRDEATFSFWLSKCAWVTLRVGKFDRVRAWFAPGRQQISWRPRGTPGNYHVHLIARDANGKRAWLQLPDVVIRREKVAPRLAAAAAARRLRWRAYDRATPWVRVAVEYTVGQTRMTLPLGRRPLRGRASLPTLPWRADAALRVTDSSGNTTRVPLGSIGPLGRIGARRSELTSALR